jgi:hypothetical protein
MEAQEAVTQLCIILLGWGAILLLVKLLIKLNRSKKTLQGELDDLSTATNNLKAEVKKAIKLIMKRLDKIFAGVRLDKIFAVLSLILLALAVAFISISLMPVKQTTPYAESIEHLHHVMVGVAAVQFLVGLTLILQPSRQS